MSFTLQKLYVGFCYIQYPSNWLCQLPASLPVVWQCGTQTTHCLCHWWCDTTGPTSSSTGHCQAQCQPGGGGASSRVLKKKLKKPSFFS
jgi:hypothetical protein